VIDYSINSKIHY